MSNPHPHADDADDQSIGHAESHAELHAETHSDSHTESHAEPHTSERFCDVAVVGGAAAGLAAALQLGRQRRSVIVVDSGEPRNAAAAHLHGYLSREGVAPAELTAIGREEVRSFGVEVLAGRVARVIRAQDGRFRVETDGGLRIVARRVIAATGSADVMPDIDGLAEHWGRGVIHCPFCHGFEVRDQRVAHVVTHPAALHVVPLLRNLTDRLTVIVREGVDMPAPDEWRAAGVTVQVGTVTRVVAGADGHIASVELATGESIAADAVIVTPAPRPRAEPFAPLGLEPAVLANGMGEKFETDATGQTAVAGLYAAGDIAGRGHQVIVAAADGSQVGAMVSVSLAEEEMGSAARTSGNQEDWDHRYSGEQIWSGNPNGTLVGEVAGLAPGLALDVGAGEGGDALWLAERGWQVTAADISERALHRVGAAAGQRGLAIDVLHADANAHRAFPEAAFDLVSAQYASIPRTPDGRGLTNILRAVAPGGTLLVVGHDLEPIRAAAAESAHGHAFDPDAYVRVEDFAAAVAHSPQWDIVAHEKRPRPAGAASSHHVDDIVLRATRRPARRHTET